MRASRPRVKRLSFYMLVPVATIASFINIVVGLSIGIDPVIFTRFGVHAVNS